MSLGEKVKTLREKRGMNQKQVAESSGISPATVSRIESGLIKELKSDALKRLSEALGVTVDYLSDRTNKLTPSDIIDADPEAQYIFRVYEKLSAKAREALKNFLHYLELKEEFVGRGISYNIAVKLIKDLMIAKIDAEKLKELEIEKADEVKKVIMESITEGSGIKRKKDKRRSYSLLF
jgi:transcriptional regulator with XRE-family HTH domain